MKNHHHHRRLLNNLFFCVIVLLLHCSFNNHANGVSAFVSSNKKSIPNSINRHQKFGRILIPSSVTTATTTTCRKNTQQHAQALNTALEWLDLDQQTFDTSLGIDDDDDSSGVTSGVNSISWIDPSATVAAAASKNINDNKEENDDNNDDTIIQMPIYPLGACYLPFPDTIHTLNNVEPRNIQMALDLTATTDQDESQNDSSQQPQLKHWKDSRFCVVLRAADTGRIASVGTVMKIVSIEPQYDPTSSKKRRMDKDDDGNDNIMKNNIDDIARIIVKCRAEADLVDIVSIENPHAASRENRLVRSPEYLIANCRTRRTRHVDVVDDNDDTKSLQKKEKQFMSKLIENYMTVRSLYLQGHGSQDLPPFAQKQLWNHLPELTMIATEDERNDDNEEEKNNKKIWELAQIWQTLCYTVREGKQINLSSDVNEVMIDAACQQGGPLKLPVHLEDLPPDVRYQVSEMERMAQQEYLALRLDPCLDFQRLLCTTNLLQRLEILSTMVRREQKRLEHDAINGPKEKKTNAYNKEQPRKGAWFEGFE